MRDIVYNTISSRKKGWKGPCDFNRFIALCRTIRSQAYVLSISFGNSNCWIRPSGLQLRKRLQPPADAQWLADYKRAGRLREHFRPALNTFQTMLDTGVWKKSDLSLTYAEREAMLFNRQCAMVEDSVLMAQRGGVRPHRLHRSVRAHAFLQPHPLRLGPPLYGVLYRFEQTSGRTPEQKKYDPFMQLDYISTPEEAARRRRTRGHVFQRKESPAPDIGNCGHARQQAMGGTPSFLSRRTLRTPCGKVWQGCSQVPSRRMTSSGWWITKTRTLSASEACTVIGEATADFTLIETGNFLTDAMRAKAGADVALFLDNGNNGKDNGKGVSARFRPQTTNDVSGPSPI